MKLVIPNMLHRFTESLSSPASLWARSITMEQIYPGKKGGLQIARIYQHSAGQCPGVNEHKQSTTEQNTSYL